MLDKETALNILYFLLTPIPWIAVYYAFDRASKKFSTAEFAGFLYVVFAVGVILGLWIQGLE